MMNTPNTPGTTFVCDDSRAIRRVERPARCRCRRREPTTIANTAPIMNTYQLARFSFGNARSFAPIIIGMKKFPITAGIDGIRKKNSIITPCAVNVRLYWSSVMIAPVGREQVEAHQPAAMPPDHEEDRDRHQVQDADPLVVDGEQPRPDAVVRVQVVRLGRRRLGWTAVRHRAGMCQMCVLIGLLLRRRRRLRRLGSELRPGHGVRSVRSGVCPLLQTA